MYGDYVSGSWEQERYGGLLDIPDKLVATVTYGDGAVARKEVKKGESGFFDTNGDVIPFYVEALNRTETKEAMRKAIIDLESQKGRSTFINLPVADQPIVAAIVLEIRNERESIAGIPNTAKKFFNTETKKLDAEVVFTVVNKVIEYRGTLIEAVNDAGDNSAMMAALKTTYQVGDENRAFFPEFVNLESADQVTVAGLVLAKKAEKAFATIAEIEAEISAAIAGL